MRIRALSIKVCALLVVGLSSLAPVMIATTPAKGAGTWVLFYSEDFNPTPDDPRGWGHFQTTAPEDSPALPYVYAGVMHLPPGTFVKTQGFRETWIMPARDPATNEHRDYLVEAGIRLPWTTYSQAAFWLHRAVDGNQTNVDEFDIVEAWGAGNTQDPPVMNIYWSWDPKQRAARQPLDMSDWNPYLWNKFSGWYRPGTAQAYTWVGSNWQPDAFSTPATGGVFDSDTVIAFSNELRQQGGPNTDPASFLLVDWVRVYQCSDASGCWGRSPN